jgi:choline dehydrogenase-like flavoprotein
MNTKKTVYDAIIIGSGPGGATAAKELTAKGKKVLILEWGPGGPVRGTLWQYIREQCWPGRGMLIVWRNFLGMVRGITTGGSSLFYYASCFPIPHYMLARYGIDLKKEEAETRKELPISPLKPEMITPMAAKIMDAARSLGLKWNLLDKFMYQDKWRSGYKFGYYGDPGGVKWSAKMYADEAVAGGAEIINGARVKKIIFEGVRATGVEYIRRGRGVRAYAEKIIVSAGGIGTPVILRGTGFKEAGKNFFYDPLITVCGKVDSLRARKDEIPMTAGCHFPDEGIMMTDMALPWAVDQVFTAQVLRFWRLFEHRKTLRIMIKVRDDLSGRLTDSGGVRKVLTDDDRHRLNRGFEMAKQILEKAGAKGIYKTWYLAAHPGGTVKIGEFIDSDLKVIGKENLYVCDCSVLPEPWGLPPTLTLICLAKRLAKHLLAEKISAPGKSERSRTSAETGRPLAKKIKKSPVK